MLREVGMLNAAVCRSRCSFHVAVSRTTTTPHHMRVAPSDPADQCLPRIPQV